MDDSILKEHAERCRSLAAMADQFTKRRLLDLAETYDRRLSKASMASSYIKAPVNLAGLPPEAARARSTPTGES
jgi:hypothetical protein